MGSACGKNIKNKTIDDLNNRKLISKFTTFDLGKSGQNVLPNNFANDFCGLIKEGGNPFILEKYIFNDENFKYAQEVLDVLKKEEYSCDKAEVLINHYPLQIFKIKTNKAENIFLAFNLNKKHEIESLNIKILDNDIHFSLEMIKGADGNKLATFVFRKAEAISTRPLVLIKTPYFHNYSDAYFFYVKSFLEEGYNVAISENRGVHMSDGDFEWLTQKNISDGKSVVEYLAQTPFSNGKILNYGVSYDGFNALATAISNPKGLVATIACSSPINAFTDSFTANGTFEHYILNYIWERETGNQVSNLHYKLNYLKQKKTPLAEYDNIIFGRDIKEWEDILTLNSKNEIKGYWSSRDLSARLKNIQTQIFHAAGFDNDQDSRDVLLAWDHVKALPNHHLFLHLKGHGCGDFFKTDYYKKITQYIFASDQDLPVIPRVIQQKSDETYFEDNMFPPKNIVTKTFSIPTVKLSEKQLTWALANKVEPSNIISVINDNMNQDDEERIVRFSIPFDQNSTIAGLIELDLNLLSISSWAHLSMSLIKERTDGSTQTLHSIISEYSRSSLLINDQIFKRYYKGKIITPPILHKFAPGEKLVIILKTNATLSLIDFYSSERENYFEENQDGYIFIVGKQDSSTHLHLPIEIN